MARALLILIAGFLMTGCMVARYTPLTSVDDAQNNLQLRVTLDSGSQYVLYDAAIDSETVSGTTGNNDNVSFPMTEVRMVEHADGRRFDSGTALRLVGIGITVAGIIVVSCAIDKDCRE